MAEKSTTEKVKNTFSILAETDRKLREICQMVTPHSNQGDVIDWLVKEKYDELVKSDRCAEQIPAIVAPDNGHHPGPAGDE